AIRQLMGPDPAPDAVARLEDDDRLASLAQPPRGREPGVPGADDADVGIYPLRHGGRTVLDPVPPNPGRLPRKMMTESGGSTTYCGGLSDFGGIMGGWRWPTDS